MDKATKARWDRIEERLQNKDDDYRNRKLLKRKKDTYTFIPILETKSDEEMQVICQQLLASMV